MPRPALTSAPEFYHNYINAVSEDDLEIALNNQTSFFNNFFKAIPIEKREFRYADGKWTIKEIIQHLIDAERVFAYRALRFARKDTTPLAGFDENNYAENAKTESRNWDDLIEEFNTLRQSSALMFHSFDEEQLNESGIANSNPISVMSIGFILVGHVNHHINIIKERYF